MDRHWDEVGPVASVLTEKHLELLGEKPLPAGPALEAALFFQKLDPQSSHLGFQRAIWFSSAK